MQVSLDGHPQLASLAPLVLQGGGGEAGGSGSIKTDSQVNRLLGLFLLFHGGNLTQSAKERNNYLQVFSANKNPAFNGGV